MPNNVEEAITHILEHWKRGETLQQIADRFSLDAGNLARAFKQRCKVTVKQYSNRMRMEYVATELRRNSPLARELAEHLGFLTEQAYHRWVVRVFKRTWSEMKEKE